jgi:TonB family protein
MKAVLPYRSYLLPWDVSLDEEQRFRHICRRVATGAAVLALLMSVLPVPESDPTVARPVPPRLARLVLEKPAPIPPPPAPVVEPVKPEASKPREPVPPSDQAPRPRARTETPPTPTARERAGKAGLLPFADQLAELRDNQALSSITSGGTRYTGAVGEAPQVERALITSRAGAGSGGINTANLSRNAGGSGLGGRATTQVTSGMAALGGGAGGAPGGADADSEGRGGHASRSREEIEMVFDQNKGAIYALYNRALRSNPALQGKLVLKLTIEASGEVSSVEVVSSELADEELERKLVQRVKMFRFAAKDVPPVTTTKPIDFFPA